MGESDHLAVYETTGYSLVLFWFRAMRRDVDFGAIYGGQWAWLTDATPASVVFAVGSPVIVDAPRVIPAK